MPSSPLLSCCVLAEAATASADDVVGLDCSQKSLADAVRDVRDDRRTVILFTGICAGPITIKTDGLTIIGVSPAIIDGGGGNDAVTVNGAGRVSLAYLEVRNGLNGIHAVNGAHLTLAGVTAHDNVVSGIALQTASSAALFDVAANDNGAHGIDVGNGAAATVGASLTATGNLAAGLNVNGSNITFSAGDCDGQRQRHRDADCRRRQRVHQRPGHGHECGSQPRHGSDGRRCPHADSGRHLQRLG